MDAFQEASEIERAKMTQLFELNNITDFSFTPVESYEREDGYYNKATKAVVFEVKVRNLPSDKYDSTIIEYDKVQHLLAKGKELNRIPFIFFFFNDNKYMAVKLSHDTYYHPMILKCPKTTMGDSEWVYKRVVDFNITNIQTIN